MSDLESSRSPRFTHWMAFFVFCTITMGKRIVKRGQSEPNRIAFMLRSIRSESCADPNSANAC